MNRKEIILFSLSPIAASALGLLTVPAIAWVFQPEDIGRISIFQSIAALLLFVSVLGLDQAYMREFFSCKDKISLLRSCLLPGVYLLIIISIISLFFLPQLSVFIYSEDDQLPLLLTIFVAFANHALRFSTISLRFDGRGFSYFMILVFPKILQLALIGLVFEVVDRKEFTHLIGISFLTTIVAFLIGAWTTRDRWYVHCENKMSYIQRWQLFKFGYPLLLSSLAFWGLSSTSIYALSKISTLNELALYSVTVSFAGIAVAFQTIVSTLFFPIIYKHLSDGGNVNRIEEVHRQVVAMICAITVLYGTFSWLTEFMLPAQYVRIKYMLVCCALQPLFYVLSDVTSLGVNMTRKTKLTFLITFTAMLLNIALCIELVPDYGADGAVFANAISFFFLFVARTEAGARVWIKFPRKKMYLQIFFVFCLSVLTMAFGSKSYIHISIIWGALIPIIVIMFRREWLQIFRMIHHG